MEFTMGTDTFPAFQPVPVVNPRRALVVDQDDSQLEVLSYRLDQLGFQVDTLRGGRRVLDHAERLRPQLILIDVELPDADGFQLCEQLCDHPQTAGIPIIIVSETSRVDIVRQARASGSRFFLRKPYDPNALMLLIQHAVDEPR